MPLHGRSVRCGETIIHLSVKGLYRLCGQSTELNRIFDLLDTPCFHHTTLTESQTFFAVSYFAL